MDCGECGAAMLRLPWLRGGRRIGSVYYCIGSVMLCGYEARAPACVEE